MDTIGAVNTGLRRAMGRPKLFPRVSKLDPLHYNGSRWAIDGRSSERYTGKTWRMVVHVILATLFG